MTTIIITNMLVVGKKRKVTLINNYYNLYSMINKYVYYVLVNGLANPD